MVEKITGEYVEFSAFSCGVLALSLIFAAYASQSLRGAIQAVPNGQWESGAALGLSRAHTFLRIIMPQVWRHALPGLSNQWLVLLKDTALISLIGVDDLMRQTDLINTNEHQPFTWYGLAALIYLAITLISQVIIARLEKRFTRFERGVNNVSRLFSRHSARNSDQFKFNRRIVADCLCVSSGFTFLLSMENKLIKVMVNGYLMLFTGTPLLVQFFLIYHGPGQFQWIVDSFAWQFLSDAWFVRR
ncbi:arginine transporter permease subunit ArtQ [Actinobacillus equuli]|nr:arginine transporter permease subunit ArtQ [Actinobacillus equuli]